MISDDHTSANFRSRKVGSLLAFLALNRDRAISNVTLQDLLWPDSDGDRQAQSLRRAIADLRDALAGPSTREEILVVEQGKTHLAPGVVEADTDQFIALLTENVEPDGFEIRVAEALALYGGPLLAPLDDDWVFAYRRQFEERYCQALNELCARLCQNGQAKDAARISQTAILLAPLREEPYISSIQAYASMGNRAMAVRQYEALAEMLDDHFGQTPSDAAALAAESPEIQLSLASRPPDAKVEPTPDSRFYIERQADGIVNESLKHRESLILVFGPRQTGKTSLLARAAGLARASGTRVAVTDFQALSRSELERPATLYRALLFSLSSQLGLDYEPSWNDWVGPNSNLDAQVDAILKKSPGPICWAMDEVDRVFGTEFSDDFFGLIRSWHNRRALDPDGPWQRLSILISYATEAHLFIEDLNQSPFNVGLRVNLRDFSEAEVAELGQRHGSLVAAHSGAVYELTKGHPYLTRRAFSFLQAGGSIQELQEQASTENGPFGDHLKHMINAVRRDPDTASQIKRILHNEELSGPEMRSRLVTAGLLSASDGKSTQFRVPAYRDYLLKALV